jgi:MraZ protein
MPASHAPARGGKFLGSYQHQLDEKGRVSLPAPFRREAAEQRFVLVQHPPALALYPEIEWLKVEERLSELRAKNPESRVYVLSVLSNAVEVVPDGQGRILIPQRLLQVAELAGTVLLVGAIDRIELWNPKRFDEATADAGKFDGYAPQIFR